MFMYLNLQYNLATQAMLQYLEKLQQEDLNELIKKRETQRQLMEDVNKANDVRDTVLYKQRIVFISYTITYLSMKVFRTRSTNSKV